MIIGIHILCEILKHIFKESRPIGSCKTNYGFPSAHSSCAFALMTYFMLESYLLPPNC